MRASPVGIGQPPSEAMESLGIKPGEVGATKRKHDEQVSDHNHPKSRILVNLHGQEFT